MQLPFAKLLGLASGAVGLVQKAFTHNSGKGNFDAELKEALTGKETPGEEGLMKMLREKGIMEKDVLDSLMGCPSGTVLFQFMAELKKIGINPKDMGFLLRGEGAKVSDDAISKLLISSGLEKAEIERIMNDQKVKAQVAMNLAASFKALIQTQAVRDGLDPAAMVKLATADAATVEELVAAAQTGLKTAPSQESAFVSSSQAAAEIRSMLANALTGSGETASAAALVGKLTATAEKTFDISRETLGELFFSTDKAAREEAVAQVTRQVNAYLAAQGNTPLKAEVLDALSLIKAAMSEEEFSGVDNSLKLLKPGLVVADTPASMDRNLYAALAKQLSSGEPTALYEKQMQQVMNQIRRALPAHIKNSEGSVTLKLNPPMLGRVEINMNMNDGQLQAAFKTDQAVTRDILLQNIHVLRESLAEQGIRATNFTVTSGLDGKPSNDGYAFGGQERHGHGFSRNDRRSWTPGRAIKGDEDFVYTRSTGQGEKLSGLDIIA
jgi:flagellar hook-length control protein FliK